MNFENGKRLTREDDWEYFNWRSRCLLNVGPRVYAGSGSRAEASDGDERAAEVESAAWGPFSFLRK